MQQTIYQLWDTETGNLIGVFSSLQEAFLAVREAVERDGAAAFEAWGLESVTVEGDHHVIGSGTALAESALANSPA